MGLDARVASGAAGAVTPAANTARRFAHTRAIVYARCMANAAELRRLALALPEVEEKSHFGRPDFRVRDKIFAGLSEPEVGYVKLTPELAVGLTGSRPQAFFAASGAWGLKGWTHVRLAQLGSAELKELLLEAFRLTAPKRLLGAHADAAKRPRVQSRTSVQSSTKKPLRSRT
jgi:hypothetical protein